MSLPQLFSRIRHFRGHGLHSPFVYSLKREVFMKKNIRGENIQLFNSLTSKGIDKKTAIELQNMHNYCNFLGFEIVDSKNMPERFNGDTFYIVPADAVRDVTQKMFDAEGRIVVAALSGTKNPPSGTHEWLRIGRGKYWILLKNEGFAAQIFKL